MTKLVVAFAVAVVLGTAAIVLQRGAGAPEPATSGAVNTPEPVTGDTAAWRAAFPLDTPEVEPVLAGDRSGVATALAAAHAAFRAGRFGDAATQFEQIWTDASPTGHAGAHWAAFYLGLCRLHLDEVPNGIEYLRHAQASREPHLAAMAQWYALVGIARLRDPSSALPEVRDVCARPGPYQARACEALTTLTR